MWRILFQDTENNSGRNTHNSYKNMLVEDTIHLRAHFSDGQKAMKLIITGYYLPFLHLSFNTDWYEIWITQLIMAIFQSFCHGCFHIAKECIYVKLRFKNSIIYMNKALYLKIVVTNSALQNLKLQANKSMYSSAYVYLRNHNWNEHKCKKLIKWKIIKLVYCKGKFKNTQLKY